MYKQYFHLSELPFSIAPDPHFIYMSRRHQEGLAHLLYGVSVGGGFIALTGEVGTGKTTLCRCLLEELPANIDIALILNPKLNAIELLATVCDELGIAYDKQAPSLKNLVDALNLHLLAAHAKGRRTVLLIDEAQNLSMEVLEQVRLLTNLETSKTKLLQIILVGQPELKQMLNRLELRQLSQRITARYHLQPLSHEETRTYIRHRLRVCGGDPELFKERAVRKIYQLSGGIPRVINILCDRALLGAYAENASHVTPGMVKQAADETLAGIEKKPPHWRMALTGIAVSVLLIGGYHAYGDRIRELRTAFHWGQEKKPLANTLPKAAAVPPPPPLVQTAPVAQTSPVVATPPAPTPKPPAFADWIADADLTLPLGLANALKLFGKPLPVTANADCEALKSAGVLCQLGKATWQEILAMNRPVLLEFALSADVKRYALLTGLKQGNPVLVGHGEETFPLAEALALWNGYYLLPWMPPVADMRTIRRGERSERIRWLRDRLALFDGTNPAAADRQKFDTGLAARIVRFQREHQLAADGEVGTQTLFYLDNLAESPNRPHLTHTD